MKKILFITGTRADFGKLKPLMQEIQKTNKFCLKIFSTGMHMLSLYGSTTIEIHKSGFNDIFEFINQRKGDTMDIILAKTISGLSDYIKENNVDLIIVHGDRVEALAGAIVGSLNNVLVAHIEGGEVSGTVDELIRHAVSKMSQIHYVSNESARKRLLQMGESDKSIIVIGSPDIDVMSSCTLPHLDEVKSRYNIPYQKYAIFMFHPVTTEISHTEINIKNISKALISSGYNFVVIFPNNDPGSDVILKEIANLADIEGFKIFPSIRFECFLTLLKNSKFIIGNSSAGVREAPFFGVPTINIGTRQHGRANAKSICNVAPEFAEILSAIKLVENVKNEASEEFGNGDSAVKFVSSLLDGRIWGTQTQKYFVSRENL